MKTKVYINGIGGISAQAEENFKTGNFSVYNKNIFPAITPNFKKYIPAMQLRRMSTGLKMGLTAAKMALEDAGVEIPDAIITGTGQGAKIDTEKFLRELLDRQEEMLSPTSFIQSTHNTIGGQIALHLKCKGYNMTYSHNAASLESALIDALLVLEEDPGNHHVLAGGVDELSQILTPLQKLDGQVKEENISSMELLRSHTPGTFLSEGAHFFLLSGEKSANSYARLVDVSVLNPEKPDEIVSKVEKQLRSLGVTPDEIDLLITGNNGDSRFDHYYKKLQDALFKDKTQLGFKNLSGEYNTVTGFAISLACKFFKEDNSPEILILKGGPVIKPKRILIYNQYLGENHSLILLESVEI